MPFPRNSPPLGVEVGGEMEPVSLGSLPEPPLREEFFGGRLAVGYITALYADGGQGKSLLALVIATCVALGRAMLGMFLPKGPVLYLDFELDTEEQSRRAYRIARGLGLEKPPKNLFHLPVVKSLPQAINSIRKLIGKYEIVLVILDSFGPACGADPADAQSMIRQLEAIRSLGVSVLLIDHQAKLQDGQNYKGKTMFGSAFKFNLARSVLHLERVESSQGESKLILRQTKNNFGALCEDLPLRATFGQAISFDRCEITDPAFQKDVPAEQKILDSLQNDGPGTKMDLAQRTKIPQKTIENSLPKLERAGKIKKAGKQGKQETWEVIPNSPPTPTPRDGEMGSSFPKDSSDQETRRRFAYEDPEFIAEFKEIFGEAWAEKNMATQKQININRENGKKGGVKIEEGEAIVKWNALVDKIPELKQAVEAFKKKQASQ